MLLGRAPRVQDKTITLTWASTQQWMFSRSLRMLLSQRSLHNLCRVGDHGSLRTVSLLVLVPSFSASVVIVIDSVTLVVWL
jgi:hypothetical protein